MRRIIGKEDVENGLVSKFGCRLWYMGLRYSMQGKGAGQDQHIAAAVEKSNTGESPFRNRSD